MDELSREWVRGASWYLEKAVDIVINSDNPVAQAEALRRVRPGMAPLDFLYLVLKRAEDAGVDPKSAAVAVLKYAEEARRGLDEAIANSGFCPRRVATVSLSRAVARFLELAGRCVERLYLAESRPGVEFPEAYRTYSRYVEVVPVTDSAVGALEYDAAVVGLDGLYRDAAVNKVGTLPLLAAARAIGARAVAVFESYKAVPLPAPRPMEVEADVWGMRARVPLFDRAPPDLIDLFITDLGASAELEADRVFDTVLKKVFKLVVG